MGSSQSVYMANASGQKNYVMASLNPDWAIVDFITDIGLLFVGVEELKAVTTAVELPEALVTIRDLYEFLKIAAQILSGTLSVGSRGPEAALALVEAFSKTSIPIDYGDYKNVKDEGVLSMYLSASGIAGMLGASTVSVMVLSGDGKQLAMWNTGADDSWITTDEQEIVRSKYGSIWQRDPGAGTVGWLVQ
ncbi:hypothetical protein BD626DRAFT_109000 [Schizophyllum amplum]|uniref:Uncharacterized protein n=1 Tax=Schizophyllum amplum TaxID=97359 RepID=A0A550CT67_9AGAR|nr:hypothetical protein BD626DRAFT_109000 [Auriculariopsis ampla]